MTPYDVYRDFPKSYEYLVRWTPWFAWKPDRIARNRDMWKGQCERQAEQLRGGAR